MCVARDVASLDDRCRHLVVAQAAPDLPSAKIASRAAYGELVQIDGSDHRWFGRSWRSVYVIGVHRRCDRQVDAIAVCAIGKCVFLYFEALGFYLREHGAPIAFYSDKYSVFRVARKDAKGGQAMTQFGRALCELNIEILLRKFQPSQVVVSNG